MGIFKILKQFKQNKIQLRRGTKLSEGLLEISQSLFPSTRISDLEEHEFRQLLELSVVAWNIGTLSKEKQQKEIENFINSVPNMKKELKRDAIKEKKLGSAIPENELSFGSITLNMLLNMISLKEEKYPNEKWIISNIEIKEYDDGYAINVLSFPPTELTSDSIEK